MEPKAPGRPGIDHQTYINQIQVWLNEYRLDEITATMLQKAVGGQYKKAATILDEFKAGYETKELSEIPEPPEQLDNALRSASFEIWRILCEKKNQEVADIQAEFTQSKAKLDSLAEERLDYIGTLEEQLDVLQQQVAQLESQAERDRLVLSDTKEQLAGKTAQLEAAQDKLVDRDAQLAKSEQAAEQAINASAAAKLEYEQALDAQAKQASYELETQSTKHAAEIGVMNAQHGEAVQVMESQIKELTGSNQQLGQQLAECQTRAELAESQLNDAKLKLVDINELRSQDSKKADKQIGDLQTRLDTTGDKLTQVTADLAAANQLAKSATEQADKAERRADESQARFVELTEAMQQKLTESKKSD